MKTWQETVEVHPAAELLPMMEEVELVELAADIKKNGLRHRLLMGGWGERGKRYLIDGRNRLAAIDAAYADDPERLGKELRAAIGDAQVIGEGDDSYEIVISANLHRRHLTRDQKREFIGALLKAQPERSDRAIAGMAQVHHQTVGVARGELESGGGIIHLGKRVGADGKLYPVKAGGEIAHLAESVGAAGKTDPADRGRASEEIPHLKSEPVEEAASPEDSELASPHPQRKTASDTSPMPPGAIPSNEVSGPPTLIDFGKAPELVADALFAAMLARFGGEPLPEGCRRNVKLIDGAPLLRYRADFLSRLDTQGQTRRDAALTSLTGREQSWNFR